MKPPFPEDILSAWFDREADPHEQQEVLRRLETAEKEEKAATERELDQLELLSAALRSLPQQAVPTDVTSQILQRISSSTPIALPAETAEDSVSNGIAGQHTQPLPLAPVKRRSRWLTGMLPVAVCVLALIVMVKLLDTPTSPQTEAVSLPALSNGRNPAEQESLVAGDFDAETRPASPGEGAAPLGRSFKNSVRQNDFNPPGVPQDQFSGPAKKIPMIGPEQMAQLPSQTFTEGLNVQARQQTAQFFRLYEDPTQLEVGQIVDAIQQQGDEVAVIQLTVVDLNQGLEQLEVLLARNNIPVRSSVDFTDNYYRELDRDQRTGDKVTEPLPGATPPAANEQEQQAATRKQELLKQQQADRQDTPVQLYAFYVETSGEQLQAALKDIQQQKMLDSLTVNSPESLLALTPTNRSRVRSLAYATSREEHQPWSDQEQAENKAQRKSSPPQSPPVRPLETAPAPAVTTAPASVPQRPDNQPGNPLPKSSEERGNHENAEERNAHPPAEEPAAGVSKAVPQAPIQRPAELKPGTEPPGDEKPAAGEKSPQSAATPSPPRPLSENATPPAPAPADPDLETVRSKPPAQFKIPRERQPAEPMHDEAPPLSRPTNQPEDQTREFAEEPAQKLAMSKKRLQIVFMVVPAPIPLVPAPANPPAPGPN